MKKSLNSIINNIGIEDQNILNDVDITGVSMYSKSINEGNIFVAIKGLSSDGHDFIDQAINSGASAIVTNGCDLGPYLFRKLKWMTHEKHYLQLQPNTMADLQMI